METTKEPKPKIGDIKIFGEIEMMCLGTSRAGITSWITTPKDLAAKPLGIDFALLDKSIGTTRPKRLTALEKVTMANEASKRARASLSMAKASLSPIQSIIESYKDWNQEKPNSTMITVLTVRGYELEQSDQGYRFVKKN